MTFRCDSCGESFPGTPVETITRQLCKECNLEFQGLAVGLIAGGGVAGALSTAGWLPAVHSNLNDAVDVPEVKTYPEGFSRSERRIYSRLVVDGFTFEEAADAVRESRRSAE